MADTEFASYSCQNGVQIVRISQFSRASSVLLCLALALPAAATTVLVTGTLKGVETGLTSEFQIGQSYSWTYSFDPGAHDFNATATRGDYREAILAGSLAIGSYSAQTSSGTIVVDDGLFGSGVDRYSVEVDAWNGSVSGPSVHLLFPYAIGMEFDDPSDAALTDDLLASSLPTIAQYPSREFTFSFAQSINPSVAYGVQRVYGTIDSISELSEPSTILLALMGLLAAASVNLVSEGYRRKKFERAP